MEKIININFQGRVIPIEESAYDALSKYTDGLKGHFANEESGDEIINDIENRIAELLTARLKQGAPCINIADLNAVIDSIGRIEEIRAAEGEEEPRQQGAPQPQPAMEERFHRNADDKVIAGVCSGIANRMNMDPVVVRVLFVVLFGALFWIYILLWLIVPLRSTTRQITHRLFRNPDDKAIAGVCGGLGVYFRIESWKVRLIFLAPLLVSILFRSMDVFTWHMGIAPGFFVGSFGSTFFILYVILWIALPYASTSTDKMEMRGERIDINSIKAATQARAAAPPYPRKRNWLLRVIGILFKAFFLLIAGSIALGLFGALIGLTFAGMATMPFTDFFLSSWEDHVLVWTAVALTLGVPLLALVVWLIRRIMGVRSRRHYLGYVFAGLWIIGVVCGLMMTGKVIRDFTVRSVVGEEMQITQPSTGRMEINVASNTGLVYLNQNNHFFGDWNEGNDAFRLVNKDSLWLNNVKVAIEQSPDSMYHVYEVRAARGVNTRQAAEVAGNIGFGISQLDSVVTLARGFTISKKDKFRNQQVLLTVQVPVGKRIWVSPAADNYSWYTISGSSKGINYSEHWNVDDEFETNTEYLMTSEGLKDLSPAEAEEEE